MNCKKNALQIYEFGCCIIQFTVVCRGYGGFGALGHYVYHRELLPRKVNGPWEGKISHIATRGAHTAAITDSGWSGSCLMLIGEDIMDHLHN
jgi:hypothetical protein